MTTSAAQSSTASTPDEPLASLLSAIEAARALPQSESYESGAGDPLAALSANLHAEAARQQTAPPAAWDEASAGWNQASQPTPQAQAGSAKPEASNLTSAARQVPSTDVGVDARVGREVLAALQSRPLDGLARAIAVARLSAQLDNPDPQELRNILAILVTGQTD